MSLTIDPSPPREPNLKDLPEPPKMPFNAHDVMEQLVGLTLDQWRARVFLIDLKATGDRTALVSPPHNCLQFIDQDKILINVPRDTEFPIALEHSHMAVSLDLRTAALKTESAEWTIEQKREIRECLVLELQKPYVDEWDEFYDVPGFSSLDDKLWDLHHGIERDNALPSPGRKQQMMQDFFNKSSTMEMRLSKDRVVPSFTHVFIHVAYVTLFGTTELETALFSKTTPYTAAMASVGKTFARLTDESTGFPVLLEKCRDALDLLLNVLVDQMDVLQHAQAKRLEVVIEDMAAKESDQWEVQRAYVDPISGKPSLASGEWTLLDSFTGELEFLRLVKETHAKFDMGIVIRKTWQASLSSRLKEICRLENEVMTRMGF